MPSSMHGVIPSTCGPPGTCGHGGIVVATCAWSGSGITSSGRTNCAARSPILVARYSGSVPADLDALRALPGIGRYTAGAMLSFAFGRDAAVLDTNVRRVLGRVFFGPRRLGRLRGEARLWDLAESLVPAGRGYDFNQALMDFGATWCTPRRPRCAPCPMRRFCATFSTLAAADRA